MARRDFVLVCSSDLAAESRQVLLGTRVSSTYLENWFG